MTTWRFGDYPEAGDDWLKNPSLLSVYIEYQSEARSGGGEWRRLLVVTKAWLDQHLKALEPSEGGALHVILPTMLVLPDLDPSHLREAVDAAVRFGGLDHYSTKLTVD